MMSKMRRARLDEIGSDFAVIYPTSGLRLPRIQDDETRRAATRAYKIVSAEYFQGLEDRMTPAAIIPMHTPEEAIAKQIRLQPCRPFRGSGTRHLQGQLLRRHGGSRGSQSRARGTSAYRRGKGGPSLHGFSATTTPRAGPRRGPAHGVSFIKPFKNKYLHINSPR